MYEYLKHGTMLKQIVDEITPKLDPIYKKFDAVSDTNQFRVLKGFQMHRVGDTYLHGSTGYGYDDYGRDTLEKIYADVFGGEEGLVRPQLISGTHAITTALFGILRPGDELMYVTGKPYDTLEEVIGLRGSSHSSMKSFNIECKIIPLHAGKMDIPLICDSISMKTKVVAIQRSCGYDKRPSFSIAEMETAIQAIKVRYPHVIIFVDNCYGEFVETKEPCHVGADLIAGSLIKNPGGGLAKAGGYIVGKQKWVEQCAERLTAPGLGREVGPTLQSLSDMYQGFFLAPHVTCEALKGAVFTSAFLSALGMETTPAYDADRTDLIQSVTLHSADRMIAFCQAIQKASPINSYVKPEPSQMPGYEKPVIMAAGTFVQGASIELSADGPIEPPYTAYVQGGLTLAHVKIAVLTAVDHLLEQKLMKIPL